MENKKEELKEASKLDTITAGEETADKKSAPAAKAPETSSVASFSMIDNKIPHRGVLWYILFVSISLGASAIIIYLSDWALLFFVAAFAVVTLWRGNISTNIKIEINSDNIKVNTKIFPFEQIESWYFSGIGDDFTITFQPIKKYLPRLTYIFSDSKYIEQIRKALGDKVPETEPREEAILDFLIRKLKI